VFSAIIALVAIRIFQQPAETYVTYLITGFVVWDLIGAAISGGTMSFLVGEGYMRQYRLPYIIYPLRTVSSLAVNSAFTSIAAVVAIVFLTPQSISFYWLYWPLVMLMLYLFAIPLAVLAGLANVRFRDFQHAAGLAVFLLWYLSPTIVIREVYDSPGLKPFTDLNPFASALDIFRAIMTERAHPTLHDVALVVGATIVLWILALLALKVEGRKLIFYL
jgi:ABC-type polysaccharide/polyol phosphate export permease